MKAEIRLTGWQQFLLVLVRFSIGWHLFYQGYGKAAALHWSADSYLRYATGPLAWLFQKMASSAWWLKIADQGTIWGLMILGVLLMVGLLTRVSSVAAILLLMSFYAAQPPLQFYGFPSHTPDGSEMYVNKVLIEVLALMLCLAFNTGRISGLDMLVQPWLQRVRSRSRSQTAPADAGNS